MPDNAIIQSLTPQEVDKILSSMGMSRIDIGNDLNIDDVVKVNDGPFSGMYGKIKSIDIPNNKIEVLLDLFGQETTVELEIAQISKS